MRIVCARRSGSAGDEWRHPAVPGRFRPAHRQARTGPGAAAPARAGQGHGRVFAPATSQLVDVGTVFEVAREGSATSVSVSEGAVLADPDGARAQIGARRAARHGRWRERAAGRCRRSPSAVGAFDRGQLIYVDEPLEQVVADLRRSTGIDFSTTAAIRARRFSGTLSVAEVKRDPRSLEPLLGVSLRAIGSGLEDGRKGLGIRTLTASATLPRSCPSPPPATPLPDRSMSLRGRSARRRSPSAGRPGSASRVRDSSLLSRPAPAIRGRMDAGDRARPAGDGQRPQAEEGRRQRSYLLVADCPAGRCASGPSLIPPVEAPPQPAPRTRSRTSGHCRHRQQARHAVAALPRPMERGSTAMNSSRWALPGPRRSRRDRSAFPRPISALAATSCSSAESPIPASAARPSRRSANISATCAPATAGPTPT